MERSGELVGHQESQKRPNQFQWSQGLPGAHVPDFFAASGLGPISVPGLGVAGGESTLGGMNLFGKLRLEVAYRKILRSYLNLELSHCTCRYIQTSISWKRWALHQTQPRPPARASFLQFRQFRGSKEHSCVSKLQASAGCKAPHTGSLPASSGSGGSCGGNGASSGIGGRSWQASCPLSGIDGIEHLSTWIAWSSFVLQNPEPEPGEQPLASEA